MVAGLEGEAASPAPRAVPGLHGARAQRPGFPRGLAGLLAPGRLLVRARGALLRNGERRASTTTRGAPRLGQKLSAATSMQLPQSSLTERVQSISHL